MQLTEHFNLKEFTRSSTAKARGINNTLSPTAEADLSVIRNLKNLCVLVLEPLREHISRPLVISSGYRSPRLNAAVGGAANSQHLSGQPDLLCSRMSWSNVVLSIIQRIHSRASATEGILRSAA